MMYTYLNRPRRKAFIGAAIGAVAGIASSIIGASQQRKAQEKQFKLQQNNQYREAGLQSAANLTKAFANYNELDEEFQNRFKYGGRRKSELGTEKENNSDTNSSDTNNTDSNTNSTDSSNSDNNTNTDSNSNNSSSGATTPVFNNINYKWSKSDTSDLISGLGSGLANIAGSLIGTASASGDRAYAFNVKNRQVGSNNAVYDSAARSELLNNYYKTAMLRCGGIGKRMRTR